MATKVTIDKLIPQDQMPKRYNYTAEVLAPLHQAQAETARTVEEARLAEQQRELARAREVQLAQVSVQPAGYQTYASGDCSAWMTQAGITDQGSAYKLIMRESGCRPTAVNASSGACGIGQQLPCGKWAHTWNDPVGAMIDMQRYVFARYRSWANALAFHYANNWY